MLPEFPARDSAKPYALRLPEDVSLPLRPLPGALSHAVRLHLLRAAELTGM
ncbi:hypothetical protein MXAN_7006 [Myxococcus xanthus DK 1622]|uniref:Uncharacterized protein n=1 Tax=Myxococcus xanthus (strain DK1622) TaxID=246197 RepID=Q1CWV4_MYXXD|nr:MULTISPECIES: hypothetical protein [Myxococcus]ABF92471.1 hypothetical protein MXAN_7006 [Myxococcus xanthus DK 1622]NOJ56185.1 hypothetical protein [Myxococcus xanthus]QPM79284.1 hypothetical protein I5Q59_34480 [Myxococcus xanthus]QVW68363.1 hypothetical protein JTM82_02010 [Myxococcus xanthus DZ2]UEO05523.1 hypothetical protein K1515_02970 [Myxococcus xanthus DZ2]